PCGLSEGRCVAGRLLADLAPRHPARPPRLRWARVLRRPHDGGGRRDGRHRRTGPCRVGGGLRHGAGLPRSDGGRSPARWPCLETGAGFRAAPGGVATVDRGRPGGIALMAAGKPIDPPADPRPGPPGDPAGDGPGEAVGGRPGEAVDPASSPPDFDLPGYVAQLPHRPGVYEMFDADGTLLYVGKARDLRKRV